ncbi:tetratricopeptide repeat protein [Thalassotalea sp. LPB0316]|uniref:2OG-Fe(II) oxygenase family protein n=1 Tax=Thalassotalea sp. LPB0316 TaxID=2769490 RepID=UPI0018687842|nr:tetratricopeptide repeat protein [Thalassotalea sp. LPB0316]QOL27154.1 tetratricopeptide repeat protein [Thalassotalea sp. LPB0316]
MNLNLQNQVASLANLLNQKNYQQVISSADALLKQHPKADVLFHLKALALKNSGSLEAAVLSFQQCLELNPKQPEVLNNLGNTYKLLQQYDLAIANYEQALKVNPNFVEAKRNLVLAYQEDNQLIKALAIAEEILASNPQDVSALTSKANLLKALDRYQEAINVYQQVLTLNPRYVNALHNLGLTYKLLEDHQSALACFKQASQLAPQVAEIDFSLANTYFEINQYPLAEQSYWAAINKKPLYVDVHSTLNEFYWQLGKHQEFGKSYQLVLDKMPNSPELVTAYVQQLFAAGADQQAKAVLAKASDQGKHYQLTALAAKVAIVDGNAGLAADHYKHSLALKFDVDNALDFAEFLIKQGEYYQALEMIEKVELIQPYHQLNLGFKSLCWRLLGDERYHWLCDYQRFIKPYQLPVPQGYDNLPQYLAVLENTLLSMHDKVHEPLKQTLKNGTQTPGRLLHKPVQVIQELKHSLTQVVHQYVSELPDDPNHPLLKRKSNNIQFSGSWSVKLRPNGFHVNHVHPDGWLSSAFYIKVPDFSQFPQKSEHAGAIKFGESGIALGEREVVERIISPKAGQLVLFPSYVWHGTYGFNGDDSIFRMTSPFDVIPV